MSEGTFIILFWLIGWVIFSIGYYIYSIGTDKEYKLNKKIYVWRAFWSGGISWIGIFFVVTICIVAIVYFINDWVETKLSK